MVKISKIAYYLPEKIVSNEELAVLYPGWTAEKIFEKTGIKQRHIADQRETAGDLAENAARKLFEEYQISPLIIDFILLATQSPDYFLPTTACILQSKLGIPTTAGALDFNLGCSAYIYGLSLAKGLIASGIAKNVLFLTSETYSKHIHPMDKSVRTIFGDGAAATLVSESEDSMINEFVLGTDGSGYDKLIVHTGGMRKARDRQSAQEMTDDSGNIRSHDHLFMDGAEIFNFTLEKVPVLVKQTLEKNKLTMDQIDLFVFHQANKFMLDTLRKVTQIPRDKFYVNMEDTGNTVSSTIPIALHRAVRDGKLKKNMKVMLVGFGVGLSWGSVVIDWD
jgi:3-oxoacyl-[acyl-carrier-protein] synthase-3